MSRLESTFQKLIGFTWQSTSESASRRHCRLVNNKEQRMPTYEYVCTKCGEGLEAVQSFNDPPLSKCPLCKGKLRKVFSAAGIVFKGSGFYKTDSRSGAKSTSSAGSSSGGDSTSSSDSSSSTSSGSDSSSTSSPPKSDSGKSDSGKSSKGSGDSKVA
jgi:putative FmdB family regulatory protein